MAFIGPYQIYTIDPAETVARVKDLEKLATSVSNGLAITEENAKADAQSKFGGLPQRVSVVEDTAVFDGDERLLESIALDSGELFAVVDENDRIIFAAGQPGAAESKTVALPSEDWAHWGDSMTDDSVTGTEAWVRKLAAYTGRNHFNGGWYGQRRHQIAARQGGLPALVTVSGNVTAASGATAVTAITNNPVLVSTTRSVHGTLAGIPGTIAERTSGNITFTPDTQGTYPVPAKSRFTPTNGGLYRDRTATIWAGRNDIWDTAPEVIVSTIQAMIDYLSSAVKRVMVMEVPPSSDNPTGGSGRAQIDAINAALKAAFPAHWLPIATWLRTDEAATAAGITYTAQDLTDISNGVTPTSFRSDNLHLNGTGCTAVAYRVRQEAQKRGWLA